jgi:hypothetical protein
LFYSIQDSNSHLRHKKKGAELKFAVAVVFLFLALRTKIRPWLLSSPLKNEYRILRAVPAPVPIINATAFNIIHHQFHPPCFHLLICPHSAKTFPSKTAVSKLKSSLLKQSKQKTTSKNEAGKGKESYIAEVIVTTKLKENDATSVKFEETAKVKTKGLTSFTFTEELS